MISRPTFFSGWRETFGPLKQSQVDGLNKILDEWDRRRLGDLRWLANMLAQVMWETGETFQPVREKGGEKYLRSKPYYPWVGEGLIQVTWEANHRKFGATAPGQLMAWPIALRALFDGMTQGMFTGQKLGDFFNATRDDAYNARRIVNGLDRAVDIADLHRKILRIVTLAHVPEPKPEPAAPQAPIPDIETAGGKQDLPAPPQSQPQSMFRQLTVGALVLAVIALFILAKFFTGD